MIASWMLYAFLVSGLVSIAALALDHVAVVRRWPTRAVWFGALLLSIAWPLGSVVRRFLPTSGTPVRVLPFTITLEPVRITATGAGISNRAATVDRSLLIVWCTLSALLLLRLSRGALSLHRTRGEWKRGEIDGTSVRLSTNVGPAVVGLRSMDVVLPEWILALDAPLRAIVLRHEEEHRVARDPYLLFAAALAVALMPWNLALWLESRRLRLAIELDCDARVLRAHPSPERYGLLMLTIAQRRSVAPTLFAPMLSESTTQLERRILAMRNTTRRLTRVTVYGASAIALGVLMFAASLQAANATPSAPITAQLLPTLSVPTAIATDRVAGGSPSTARQQGNPSPRYPELLAQAGIEGSAVVEFSTDANGAPNMETFRVVARTHDLFVESIRRVLPQWRLAPNAKAHLPFVFNIEGMSGASSSESGTAQRVAVDGVDAVVITAVPRSRELGTVQTDTRGVAIVRGMSTTAAAPATANPGPQRVTANQTYFEFQVEKPVSPLPGNSGPRYPDSLRTANVEGDVLAQFVVDTLGKATMSTFKVLKSTHEMFTEAVQQTLPMMRFSPAQVGGRPVKQLVQMPFQFNLSKSSAVPSK